MDVVVVELIFSAVINIPFSPETFKLTPSGLTILRTSKLYKLAMMIANQDQIMVYTFEFFFLSFFFPIVFLISLLTSLGWRSTPDENSEDLSDPTINSKGTWLSLPPLLAHQQ
jgi:hypothetical protein